MVMVTVHRVGCMYEAIIGVINIKTLIRIDVRDLTLWLDMNMLVGIIIVNCLLGGTYNSWRSTNLLMVTDFDVFEI